MQILKTKKNIIIVQKSLFHTKYGHKLKKTNEIREGVTKKTAPSIISFWNFFVSKYFAILLFTTQFNGKLVKSYSFETNIPDQITIT